MSSSHVSRKSSNNVSKSSEDGEVIETQEQSSSVGGSAGLSGIITVCTTSDTRQQAGLNLNVVGAIKGALSSKSSKETANDGSSIENKEQHAGVQGAGAGNANANAAAGAQQQAMRAQVQRQ